MFGMKMISPVGNEPRFHIDTVCGSSIRKSAVQPDVVITIGDISFYLEVFDGKIVIRRYVLTNGIPVNDEGTIIHEEEYHV